MIPPRLDKVLTASQVLFIPKKSFSIESPNIRAKNCAIRRSNAGAKPVFFCKLLKKCKKTGHAGEMCTLDRTSYFAKAGAVCSLRKCTFFDMIHLPSITILRSLSRRLLQVAEVILSGAERTERCAEA